MNISQIMELEEGPPWSPEDKKAPYVFEHLWVKRLALPLVLLPIPLLLGAHDTQDQSNDFGFQFLIWIIGVVVWLLIQAFRGTKKSSGRWGVSVDYDDRGDAGGDCDGGGE
jgi:hypothetical protein